MPLDAHNIKIEDIVHSLNQLNSDFQNFIVAQIMKLKEMDRNYQEWNLRLSDSLRFKGKLTKNLDKS